MGTFVVCSKKKNQMKKKILQKLELIKWMDENLNEMMTAILIDNSRRKKNLPLPIGTNTHLREFKQ